MATASTATVASLSSEAFPKGTAAITAVGAGDRRRWLALAVLVASQFMIVLDISIVNVALPSIKIDLHFSQEGLQWVVTAYAIFFGGVLLFGGRLADLFGRRLLFISGLALFTVSSLLAGLAWSEGSLIAFRSLQGLGAALVSPAALSILTTMFREGRDRNFALGIWGAAAGIAGAVGVLLGGVLTSGLNWSWIFFINVPVGAVVIAISPWLLRESRADLGNRRFDFAGATAITTGLMLLVYAMTRATQHGWGAAETIGLLTASVVLVGGFFLIELFSKSPLLPLRIFRLRTLAVSNLSGLLLTAAIFSQFFLLTLYLQQVLHYSPLKTGIAYLGIALSAFAFSPAAQALVTKFGVKPVLPAGFAFLTIALVLFARLPVHAHYFPDLFPAFPIAGLGLTVAFVATQIGGLTGVHEAEAGVAAGLINTSQEIGGAIGIAVVATISTTFTSRYVTSHAGVGAVSGAALTHGFEIGFYTLAGIAAAGAVLAALMLEPQARQLESEQEEAAGATTVKSAADRTLLPRNDVPCSASLS